MQGNILVEGILPVQSTEDLGSKYTNSVNQNNNSIILSQIGLFQAKGKINFELH